MSYENSSHNQLPPNEQPEGASGAVAPSTELAGWTEYAAATIRPDGKAYDDNGNEVEYPWHLVE